MRAAGVPKALAGVVPLARAVAPGHPVLRTIPLPWRANMVGVSFASADRTGVGTSVVVRVLSERGWSDWTPLRLENEDAPDGAEAARASRRVSTDPQWIGTASRIQVRVSAGQVAVADVRVHVINTLGDARPANVLVRAGRALRSFLSMRPATDAAQAMTNQPKLLTRAQWGAKESWRSRGPSYSSEVRMVVIHHTDNRNTYTQSQSAAVVRAIYHYHVFTRGYNDIAYSFLLDRFGQIFEGRFGGVDRAVVGAHTMGFNAYTTGVAIIGKFTDAAPPTAALYALKRLLAWKMDVHHIPPAGLVRMRSAGNERYARGTVVRFNRISGHRNAKPTACPGNALYAKLTWLRGAVDKIGQPKIYVPALSTPTVRPDGDGVNETATFTASFSRPAVWTLTVADGAGTVRRTYTGAGTFVGTGDTPGITWDGTDTAGVLLPTGRYTWRLEARDEANLFARPATGSVYVVQNHPDGTLLRDPAGTYVLKSVQRVEATDEIVIRSNFGALPAVATGPGERARYVASPIPLELRDGTLFQNELDGSRFIYSAGSLRRFATDPGANPPFDAFAALGYDETSVIEAPEEYLNAIPPGQPVTDVTAHPSGSIVRDDATGALFVLVAGSRRPITELAMRSRYRPAEVVAATAGDLAVALDEANRITVRPGTLITATDGGAPWIVTDEVKRRFVDFGLFAAMGYTRAMLVTSSPADLDAISTGSTLG